MTHQPGPPPPPRSAAHRRLAFLAVAAVALLALVTACSGAPDRGSAEPSIDLSGQSYTVGGKEFIEQKILCKITVLALKSANAGVTDRCGMVGTDVVRAALREGDIDMYWEYTGTGAITHLKLPNPPTDPDELYSVVAARDRANGVVWLPRTPMNDTYTLAVDTATARRMNIQTFSDMSRIVSASGDQSTVCIEKEFNERPDGWGPLQKLYGFTAPSGSRVSIRLVDDIYPLVGLGKPCTFGEVYSTDGRVAQLGLTTLRDDKNFLPKYNASLTIRQDVFNRRPDIAQLVQPIAAALTDPVMLDLNTQVANGRDPEDVARDWLVRIQFIQ